MAKKKAPNGQLGDWQDSVPEEVQTAADEFDKAHTAKGKAAGKLNTAKDNLVATMRANGVESVRIRNGEKRLVIGSTDKINYKKPAAKPEDSDDE
jgi:hypothetical protein